MIILSSRGVFQQHSVRAESKAVLVVLAEELYSIKISRNILRIIIKLEDIAPILFDVSIVKTTSNIF